MLRENPHDYAAAEAWNRAHDVGIPVRYWPGLHEGAKNGQTRLVTEGGKGFSSR